MVDGDKFRHVRGLGMIATGARAMAELLRRTAPNLEELCAWFHDFNDAGGLSAFCHELRRARSLRRFRLISECFEHGTTVSDPGGNWYAPVLDTLKELPAFRELEITVRNGWIAEDVDDRLVRGVVPWPAVLKMYPELTCKLTKTTVKPTELQQWADLCLQNVTEARIFNWLNLSDSLDQWCRIDAFPSLEVLAVEYEDTRDLRSWPVRKLRRLVLDNCTLNLSGEDDIAATEDWLRRTGLVVELDPVEEFHGPFGFGVESKKSRLLHRERRPSEERFWDRMQREGRAVLTR